MNTGVEQWLYRLHPVRVEMLMAGPTAREAEIVARHVDYLQALAEREVVFLAGRTLVDDASTFGIVILLAATRAAAQEIVDADPAVGEGVMTAELFPFRVAIRSDAIARC